MVAGVFAELAREKPRRRFTVGIIDDVSKTSLDYDASLDIEPEDTVRAVFFGLGSDGTVGANKNTIKILGGEENLNAQAYFVYDSKKSGSQTVSHLRFGPQPIRAPYLVHRASFVGCHQFGLLDQVDVLGGRRPAPRCCSTAGTRRTRSGMRCRGPSRSRSSPRTSRSTPSTLPGSPARWAWPVASTSSSRPASSRSPACCRATSRSPRSRGDREDVRQARP
jgi:hypothetical protein